MFWGFFRKGAKHMRRVPESSSLIEGVFLQIYYFSKNMLYGHTSDPFNLVTVTASYLTHRNINITYFLLSYYILHFPCNSQFDQQYHFKVQRVMWNHYDCTDILL